jgi:6-phosphofructokinase 1
MGIKNIGIITSGGDCGGLNAVVKGVARMAIHNGMHLFVIPNGYAGLYNLIDTDKLVELTDKRVDPVNIGLAGSEAGHSRVKISKIDDPHRYDRIIKGLKKFGIDALVISGGDDTGSVVVDLVDQGIKCIHAPKTMDLNLQTYSVGGDSAIQRITDFTSDLKTTGRTHNRIMVLEVFGRYEGHTAFRGGIAANADAILIPEIPVDFDVVFQHIKQIFLPRIEDSDIHAGTYSIVVSEGIRDASGKELFDDSVPLDAFGHRKLAGAGKYVRQEISSRMKKDEDVKAFMKKVNMFVPNQYEVPEVREIIPTHLVRCGFSSAYDANFGTEIGGASVQLLANGIHGVTVVGVENGVVQYMDVHKAIKQRKVDLNQVAFHEALGVCFGRKPPEFEPSFKEIKGKVSRIY